jgi:hypothetical protein
MPASQIGGYVALVSTCILLQEIVQWEQVKIVVAYEARDKVNHEQFGFLLDQTASLQFAEN